MSGDFRKAKIILVKNINLYAIEIKGNPVNGGLVQRSLPTAVKRELIERILQTSVGNYYRYISTEQRPLPAGV